VGFAADAVHGYPSFLSGSIGHYQIQLISEIVSPFPPFC
jgi:hypothetical protein